MPVPGLVHRYYENLIAFEHASSSGKYFPKVILFIGGMGDGIGSVAYVNQLAAKLEKQDWGFVEIQLTSSLDNWGTGSLARDGNEVAEALKYLREKAKKTHVVLMGHSTGCQDSIYYTTQNYDGSRYPDIANRPKVDGIILQAGVSDREAYVHESGESLWKEALAFGKELLAKDREINRRRKLENPNTVELFSFIPTKYTDPFFPTHVDSYRWVSLIDIGGDDDYFSSDLKDSDFAKTFGQLKVPILVLLSGADEFFPDFVDIPKHIKRFESATSSELWSPYSHIIPNASHSLSKAPQEAFDDLTSTVSKFVTSLN